MTATANKSTGLEGMTAGSTAICAVKQDDLLYRGYSVNDLAEKATFEEVAYLLLRGEKPTADELAAFKQELVAERDLPKVVCDYLDTCGDMVRAGSAVPMDVCRTAVSLLGNADAESQDNSPEAEGRKAVRILAKMPQIIGRMQAAIDGAKPVDPDPSLDHAANLCWQITREKPSDKFTKTMDVSLILYAEHDYNASTFSARVISATLSDMHGAVTGAIAALKGKLHGGANEAAMDMLNEITEAVAKGQSVEDWMQEAFTQKKKLMGFGHRVYKNGDHRAPILHALGRQLAEERGEDFVKLFELGEKVQQIMLEQKSIHPNVDFPCGMTYFTMGIPVPQYTPIFVASRVAGWAAHVMEQHANNRLIRPLAEYTGPAERVW